MNPTPDHILQTGMAFWASKTLLSAVEMEVFTGLAKHPADFLDDLVALGFLQREGIKVMRKSRHFTELRSRIQFNV